MAAAQVRERFSMQGLEVFGNFPFEFQAYLSAGPAKWDKIIRATGVRVE